MPGARRYTGDMEYADRRTADLEVPRTCEKADRLGSRADFRLPLARRDASESGELFGQ